MEGLEILRRWCQGEQVTTQDLHVLLTAALAHPEQAKTFAITPENGLGQMEARAKLFAQVYQEIEILCPKIGPDDPDQILTLLWTLWLPLSLQLAAQKQQLGRPLIQGILGGQGTGKTTLCTILSLILERLGHSTLSFSIDDLYKSYEARKQLQQQDPRLIWRGPPGTHDVEVGIDLLDCLRDASGKGTVFVPRFDKSAFNGMGDRIEPEELPCTDIILFEGWFVGVRPVDESCFDSCPPPILSSQDRQFARDMNTQLREYLPLWERLDRLIVLNPVDYRLSKQWRQEAEQRMKAKGKGGMSDEEISQFVEYFWRSLHPELFIDPLVKNSQWVNLVIEVQPDHSVGTIYRP